MSGIGNAEECRRLMEQCGFADLFSFDILPYAQLTWFGQGQTLLQEGQRSPRLYYLVSGRAKLFTTLRSGRVELTAYHTAPCFLGEMELLDPDYYCKKVQAHTDCSCISVDLARCREKILNDPRFLRQIARQLVHGLTGSGRPFFSAQVSPLENRLAGFILLTARGGLYTEPHTEAAAYLGVSYRHLLYVLAGLRQQGLIEKEAGGYRILQPGRLQALAAPPEG